MLIAARIVVVRWLPIDAARIWGCNWLEHVLSPKSHLPIPKFPPSGYLSQPLPSLIAIARYFNWSLITNAILQIQCDLISDIQNLKCTELEWCFVCCFVLWFCLVWWDLQGARSELVFGGFWWLRWRSRCLRRLSWEALHCSCWRYHFSCLSPSMHKNIQTSRQITNYSILLYIFDVYKIQSDILIINNFSNADFRKKRMACVDLSWKVLS